MYNKVNVRRGFSQIFRQQTKPDLKVALNSRVTGLERERDYYDVDSSPGKREFRETFKSGLVWY